MTPSEIRTLVENGTTDALLPSCVFALGHVLADLAEHVEAIEQRVEKLDKLGELRYEVKDLRSQLATAASEVQKANLALEKADERVGDLKRELAVSAETNARMLREIAALDADNRRLVGKLQLVRDHLVYDANSESGIVAVIDAAIEESTDE
jgi:chromosome segregation ATPase